MEICDYRPPQTDLTNLWLAGNYRYFNDPATPDVDVNAGRATLTLNKLFDSPMFGYSLSGLGELGLVNLGLASIAAQGAGTARYYFVHGEPLFGFGGLNVGYATGQPQPGITLSVGAGYGRFADVTPLAKAFRIEKLLLDRKVITQGLPDSVLLAVGEEIGRWEEYAVGKTPADAAKDLAAAVVLRIQGATGATVDPRTVLAIEDEILATGAERYCGWALQAGLGYELVDPYGNPQDVVVTVSADAAYAPAPGAQLLFRALAFGPFDIVNQHTLTVTLAYEQELSATSALQANAMFHRVNRLDLDPEDSLSASAQLAFTLGKASLGIGLALGKAADATGWSVDFSLSVSMKIL
ncbi:hypothetical protein H5T55_00655 [Candidatus Bipolaricaulota bacterium]|nr:hypothetical protein [Candidatus Bipolaricaulota bacterium]